MKQNAEKSFLNIIRHHKLLASLIVMIFLFLLVPVVRFNVPYSTVIEASDGSLLGAKIAGDGQWRFPRRDTLPEKFRKCIILSLIHISEPTRLGMISYAVFCLKK